MSNPNTHTQEECYRQATNQIYWKSVRNATASLSDVPHRRGCLQNRCVQKNHEEYQRHVTLHLQMSYADKILRYGELIYVRQ